MRAMKTAIAATALLIGLPAAANAQWYVGVDAGANYLEDPGVANTDSDWGWVGIGQVGYDFGGPKAEFEVGYRDNDDINSLSTMINGIYSFLPNSAWHPFIGAGVGWAWLDGKYPGAGRDNQFAYQGLAGVAYDVSRNWALKAQYRYFATLDADFGPGSDAEYRNHSILVGLTYKFAPPPPPPAPVPVAAPAPAPAPAPVVKPAAVQKNYLVFFDFDKADITPEASRVITQAAAAAKQGSAARINLTGHTDRSGSDKYNLALSLKRANAVKDSLVSQGIPADQIAVVGKGESEPLVATPDGVREPQNRRVEIVLP
jgi:Outer membrane protein and related peptidoglycan-associated (lipo)proteins